jgi:hypothetical protein
LLQINFILTVKLILCPVVLQNGGYKTKISLRYLIILECILMAALMIAASQGDNTTQSSNNSRNASLNISRENCTDIAVESSVLSKSGSLMAVQVLNRNLETDLASGIGFCASNATRRDNAFLINGYTRPTRDSNYRNLSSTNAAVLSRAVEGTPHGHVTYYN